MPFQVASAKAFIEQLTGYRIMSDGLVIEALDANVNKRLTLTGNKALGLALIDNWFASGLSTEAANNLIVRIASNSNLGNYASRVGLDCHVKVNMAQRGQPPSPRVLYTAVEAIIGAIWDDSRKDKTDRIEIVKTALVKMGLDSSASA